MFLILTSLIGWLIFSFITSFTNIFTNHFNFFNYGQTISASILVINTVILQVTSKPSRENAKQVIKEMFTTKQKSGEVLKKDLPERHCTKCKKKQKSS